MVKDILNTRLIKAGVAILSYKVDLKNMARTRDISE